MGNFGIMRRLICKMVRWKMGFMVEFNFMHNDYSTKMINCSIREYESFLKNNEKCVMYNKFGYSLIDLSVFFYHVFLSMYFIFVPN